MFVMPRKYKSASDLPVPLDSRVNIEDVPARYEAIMSWYGGYATQAEFESRVAALVVALRAEGLEPASEGDAIPSGVAEGADAQSPGSQHRSVSPIAKSYSYDPPWTPWFMKRNEVAVVVQPPPPPHTSTLPAVQST